ncbi:S8 family serine peptidase [Pedobacter sp. L105]|uniref:S8 family serine peptidase n=1 Tax=Pedobacter sp. L105 TaxID=1641871 RepID=UPI00131E39B7|nr:S8 family serine peptidase [Pedobacter sp. L105]
MIYKKLALSLFSFFSFCNGYAQKSTNDLKNWQNMDLATDRVYGISMEKAYSKLLNGKKSVPVIVAVIDGGIDINHEDLKSVIFFNPKELPGNSKDDDANGYVDDINGWNFIGSSKGSFQYDNIDLVRLLRAELNKSPSSAKGKELQSKLDDYIFPLQKEMKAVEIQRELLYSMVKSIGKENPTQEEWRNYHCKSEDETMMQITIVKALKDKIDFLTFKSNLDGRYGKLKYQLAYLVNINYDPRAGNKEYQRKCYGNTDIIGEEPGHGTHVAGILAADRSNNIGIKGVAKDVKIMSLRAVPIGEAYDKDIANSIRYAVDNGAKVINLSLITSFSPDKEVIDNAVKYAMLNDVLIVHGAGNEGIEQKSDSYPNKKYLNGEEAKAWIEVGASGWKDDQSLLSAFSTYGKNTIDVFAPGVDIYSTWPNNRYLKLSGTSMAAPVVSALAAEIRSYYPALKATEVKDIIMKTVVKPDHKVKNNLGEELFFSDLCLSGGIVNAYKAFSVLRKQEISR